MTSSSSFNPSQSSTTTNTLGSRPLDQKHQNSSKRNWRKLPSSSNTFAPIISPLPSGIPTSQLPNSHSPTLYSPVIRKPETANTRFPFLFSEKAQCELTSFQLDGIEKFLNLPLTIGPSILTCKELVLQLQEQIQSISGIILHDIMLIGGGASKIISISSEDDLNKLSTPNDWDFKLFLTVPNTTFFKHIEEKIFSILYKHQSSFQETQQSFSRYCKPQLLVNDPEIGDCFAINSYGDKFHAGLDIVSIHNQKRKCDFSIRSFGVSFMKKGKEGRSLAFSFLGDYQLALKHLSNKILDTKEPRLIRQAFKNYIHHFSNGFNASSAQLEFELFAEFLRQVPTSSLPSTISSYLENHYLNNPNGKAIYFLNFFYTASLYCDYNTWGAITSSLTPLLSQLPLQNSTLLESIISLISQNPQEIQTSLKSLHFFVLGDHPSSHSHVIQSSLVLHKGSLHVRMTALCSKQASSVVFPAVSLIEPFFSLLLRWKNHYNYPLNDRYLTDLNFFLSSYLPGFLSNPPTSSDPFDFFNSSQQNKTHERSDFNKQLFLKLTEYTEKLLNKSVEVTPSLQTLVQLRTFYTTLLYHCPHYAEQKLISQKLSHIRQQISAYSEVEVLLDNQKNRCFFPTENFTPNQYVEATTLFSTAFLSILMQKSGSLVQQANKLFSHLKHSPHINLGICYLNFLEGKDSHKIETHMRTLSQLLNRLPLFHEPTFSFVGIKLAWILISLDPTLSLQNDFLNLFPDALFHPLPENEKELFFLQITKFLNFSRISWKQIQEFFKAWKDSSPVSQTKIYQDYLSALIATKDSDLIELAHKKLLTGINLQQLDVSDHLNCIKQLLDPTTSFSFQELEKIHATWMHIPLNKEIITQFLQHLKTFSHKGAYQLLFKVLLEQIMLVKQLDKLYRDYLKNEFQQLFQELIQDDPAFALEEIEVFSAHKDFCTLPLKAKLICSLAKQTESDLKQEALNLFMSIEDGEKGWNGYVKERWEALEALVSLLTTSSQVETALQKFPKRLPQLVSQIASSFLSVSTLPKKQLTSEKLTQLNLFSEIGSDLLYLLGYCNETIKAKELFLAIKGSMRFKNQQDKIQQAAYFLLQHSLTSSTPHVAAYYLQEIDPSVTSNNLTETLFATIELLLPVKDQRHLVSVQKSFLKFLSKPVVLDTSQKTILHSLVEKLTALSIESACEILVHAEKFQLLDSDELKKSLRSVTMRLSVLEKLEAERYLIEKCLNILHDTPSLSILLIEELAKFQHIHSIQSGWSAFKKVASSFKEEKFQEIHLLFLKSTLSYKEESSTSIAFDILNSWMNQVPQATAEQTFQIVNEFASTFKRIAMPTLFPICHHQALKELLKSSLKENEKVRVAKNILGGIASLKQSFTGHDKHLALFITEILPLLSLFSSKSRKLLQLDCLIQLLCQTKSLELLRQAQLLFTTLQNEKILSDPKSIASYYIDLIKGFKQVTPVKERAACYQLFLQAAPLLSKEQLLTAYETVHAHFKESLSEGDLHLNSAIDCFLVFHERKNLLLEEKTLNPEKAAQWGLDLLTRWLNSKKIEEVVTEKTKKSFDILFSSLEKFSHLQLQACQILINRIKSDTKPSSIDMIIHTIGKVSTHLKKENPKHKYSLDYLRLAHALTQAVTKTPTVFNLTLITTPLSDFYDLNVLEDREIFPQHHLDLLAKSYLTFVDACFQLIRYNLDSSLTQEEFQFQIHKLEMCASSLYLAVLKSKLFDNQQKEALELYVTPIINTLLKHQHNASVECALDLFIGSKNLFLDALVEKDKNALLGYNCLVESIHQTCEEADISELNYRNHEHKVKNWTPNYLFKFAISLINHPGNSIKSIGNNFQHVINVFDTLIKYQNLSPTIQPLLCGIMIMIHEKAEKSERWNQVSTDLKNAFKMRIELQMSQFQLQSVSNNNNNNDDLR